MSRKTQKKPDEINVKAFDLASAFDMKPVREILQRDLAAKIINAEPLLAEMAPMKMIGLFEFGSAVFFNMDADEISRARESLMKCAIRPNRIISEDDFTLFFGKSTGTIEGTDRLHVSEFNRDYALLVSTILSRSVSIEYYETQVNNAMAKFEQIVNVLSQQGKMPGNRKDLVKRVGFGLGVEYELAYNLSVFDDPDIIWDGGEKINELYINLKKAFDIEDRIDIIREKLSIISRSSTFIISRLESRRSNMLEWIIIILIISEIILILFGKM